MARTIAVMAKSKKKSVEQGQLDRCNVRAFERQLTKIIEEMCQGVGLQFPEWDVDEKLFLALKNAQKLESIASILARYRSLYDVAREMGIDDCIGVPFQWVYGLGNRI